ncbi:MAG TPA: bifunctional alpha,alpha-trehalose-phosphate synthase (UDP-forming)/trehalose-phosphatase [Candidatus Saccharimonadales bacterium]|nr:bifunctional alpha,alpha-trehalose-phosphate synthase (UDP-forming)/trehalose-phosphatase [Candidatus Saccharimonadales bacterium]
MAKKKFIVVSNRLPISVSKSGGRLVYTPSSGGLATALSKLYKNDSDSLWVGWPGICEEDTTPADRREITRKLRQQGCYPVFLTKRQVREYYDGYSNDTIWPLFHYFQTYVKNENVYWETYQEVNDIFADTVLRFAGQDSIIWVHDYHLMLLPGKLRDRLQNGTIGFFLHIPFPSYEIFRLLPNRTEIIKGLLGADLIGFHIYDYARHFLSSLLRTMGVENSNGIVTIGDRAIKVDAFPIGIDYEKFANARKDKETAEEIKAIKKHYKDKKIILSMDRLDYTKGILGRLRSFEYFLDNNPQYRQKVVLVMVAVPSRVEVDTYQNLKQEIEQRVSRINGKYSTVDWTPISYQFRNLPFPQVSALLTEADVALLTPLRDGMNLVAKEYVATKQNGPGVLILSEMAGAIDEMPEAISVNPNDVNSISDAITEALEMPKDEQMQKIKTMQKRLSQYTVGRWAQDFIEQLKKTKQLQDAQSDKLINKERERKILSALRRSRQRLILLDYDGTITDLVPTHDPVRSKPSEETLSLLRHIAGMRNTVLCVISGRPKDVLDSWFKGIPMILSAEHGAWIKDDNEWSRRDISLNVHRKNIIELLKQYVERTPGSSIEEKDFSIVWHYRNVPPELAQARNSSIEYELKNMLSGSDFAVHRGAKILEVKPKFINKGMIAEEFLAMVEPDFVLCIGDDSTDEDMFEVMPDNAFSIKVGLGESGARFQVLEPKNVLALLEKLTRIR